MRVAPPAGAQLAVRFGVRCVPGEAWVPALPHAPAGDLPAGGRPRPRPHPCAGSRSEPPASVLH